MVEARFRLAARDNSGDWVEEFPVVERTFGDLPGAPDAVGWGWAPLLMAVDTPVGAC